MPTHDYDFRLEEELISDKERMLDREETASVWREETEDGDSRERSKYF